MKDLNFEKLITTTGVPLYVMYLPHSNTVASGVLVKAGTRDESWPEEAGLAHALEHMQFQGTKRFPTSEKLSAYIEETGGVLNAWTFSETTFYWSRVPEQHKEKSILLLSEEINYALIPEEKVAIEMLNIIEEIRRSKDNPESYIDDLSQAFLYGSHPLGKTTLGIEESVRLFQRDHFIKFKDRLYDAANFVFIAAGNIKPEESLALFEQYFTAKPKLKENKRSFQPLKETKERKYVLPKETEQVHISLRAPIGASDEATSKSIDLFTTMISGGMSFPLFQEVRDKRGLCYAIYAQTTRFSDVGNFLIYVGTDPKRYQEALETISEVIEKAKTDEKLLKKAKGVEIGRLALKYESTGSIINEAALQISQLGKPIGYKELVEEIESITIADIKKAVDQYLKPDDLRQVFICPKDLEMKI